jgi:AcrR family transcriptional regulator
MTATEAPRTSTSPATDMRVRLCEAALACIERVGLAKTTLEDVATEASVSRQTIYRYFADRDELLLAALIVELERNAGPDPSDTMALDVHTAEDAVATLVEGAVFTLESIRHNPKLAALLASEGDSVRSTLDGASGLLFRHHADNLRPWFELGQKTGFLNADLDPDEMSEWLLRITLSLLTTEGPVERGPDELRAYLKTYLTPVLAGPGPRRRPSGRTP